MSEVTQNEISVEEGTREAITSKIVARCWQDPDFKQRLLGNPKEVLAEAIGRQIPEHVEVKILEETPNNLYLVLPVPPSTSEELSEEQLEAVAGGYFTLLWSALCWG